MNIFHLFDLFENSLNIHSLENISRLTKKFNVPRNVVKNSRQTFTP